MSDNKINVFITVDTEHSIGGAFQNPAFKPVGNLKRIYGKIGKTLYGIPMIMDIADEFGLPVVFFLEVLNKYYFGKSESREVCHYVLKRGHDVQLHLHPNYLNFAQSDPGKLFFKDNISSYDLNRQVELIQEGKSLLAEYGVKKPVAFRAGNYGADKKTLTALSKNGFIYDSSYNLAFPQKSSLLGLERLNDIVKVNDIYELPITCFQEKIPMLTNKIRPMDLNGVSYEQMKKTLESAYENKMHCVTIILHSFSFIHSKDHQYTRVGIRKNVIERFRKLCRFLSDNSQCYRVGRLDEFKVDDVRISKTAKPTLTLPKASIKEILGNYTDKIVSKLRYEL